MGAVRTIQLGILWAPKGIVLVDYLLFPKVKAEVI
jgi:hypothetical protein